MTACAGIAVVHARDVCIGAERAEDWRRERLLTNALDWTVWGIFAPAIAFMARRYRLDASSQRARCVAVWGTT
jgi:hypothetical protein